MIPLDAAHTSDLLLDLETAAREFVARFDAIPALWEQAPAGKWSAGQHADHVARSLGQFADAIKTGVPAWEAAGRPPCPSRWPLQSLVVGMLTGAKFPSGGKAARLICPGDHPDRAATLARIPQEAARFRNMVAPLPLPTVEAFWFSNPLVPRWHYRIPEALRVQASHLRHHGLAVQAIAAS